MENLAAINILTPKGTFEKFGGNPIFNTPMISGLLRCNYASMSRRLDVFVVNLYITVWSMQRCEKAQRIHCVPNCINFNDCPRVK